MINILQIIFLMFFYYVNEFFRIFAIMNRIDLDNKIDKIINLIEKKVPQSLFFHSLSVIIGILTALVAVILKTIVHYLGIFVREIARLDSTHILYFLLPLMGIIITVFYVKKYVNDSLAHGISKILYSISKNESKLKKHNKYSSVIASTFTVAFGGSVGLEAPAALTGAAIGSNLAERFHLDYRMRTLLLGCGSAAAVACIFNAPIAGTIFALEVLMLDLTINALIPLLLSAVTGSIVSELLLGQSVVFNFAVFEPFDLNNTLLYVFLGIICGLVGLYFTRTLEFIEDFFSTKLASTSKRIILGGLLLCILIFLFPPLYGEGYETLMYLFSPNPENVLNLSVLYSYSGNILSFIIFLLLIVFLKAYAVGITTGSGGVGGVFAPSLFLGGITGFIFALIINMFSITNVSQRNFALVGMAGTMSAIMQAPLTAVFLIAEITGGYALFIPIIITATFAYITIHRFEKNSVYTKKLALSDNLLTHNKDQAILTLLKMDNLIETDFHTVNYEARFGDLISEVVDSTRNIFPVVDDNREFKGLIFLNDIRKIMFNYNLYDEIEIKNLTKKASAVIYKDAPMKDVMKTFESTNEWNLPVIDEAGKYIGFLSKSKVLTSYRELLREVSHEI